MKRNLCKIISVALVLITIFATGSIFASAASESSYTATFSIKTDKSSVKAGENVKVSLNLKTNYYIYAMEVPVIYDGDAFAVQNTSSTSLKSFLTFQGQLASAYQTNGNWKSPATFYTNGNSNSEYWSQKSVMDKYKIAFASWAANTALNNGKAIKLSTEETIVSFVLKAKKDISDVDGLIFISGDFQKTSSYAGGRFFCGRSKTEKIKTTSDGYVPVGQTLKFTGSVPKKEEIVESGAIEIDFKAKADLKEQLNSTIIKDYKLVWESSDESVVTVDDDGNIYGAAKGEATVKVTSKDGKFTKTFDVKVTYSTLQMIIIIFLFGWLWYV